MKRGAYFFVLDAFIAGVIIISSLVIVLSTLTINERPTQNYVIAEDFISLLESTLTSDYGGRVAYDLARSGVINDTSLTLLEQIVYLYDADYVQFEQNISSLLEEVSALAPENNGLAYYVTPSGGSPVELYRLQPVAEHTSRVKLSAQRVTMIRGQDTVVPFAFEVQIWR